MTALLKCCFVQIGTINNDFSIKKVHMHTFVVCTHADSNVCQITDHNISIRLFIKMPVYDIFYPGFITGFFLWMALSSCISRDKLVLFRDSSSFTRGCKNVLASKFFLYFESTIIISASPNILTIALVSLDSSWSCFAS